MDKYFADIAMDDVDIFSYICMKKNTELNFTLIYMHRHSF